MNQRATRRAVLITPPTPCQTLERDGNASVRQASFSRRSRAGTENRSPWPRARVAAAVDDERTVHEHVRHACRVRLGLLERVGLTDGRRIEDRHVGHEAFAKLSAIAQPEDLSWQRGHL